MPQKNQNLISLYSMMCFVEERGGEWTISTIAHPRVPGAVQTTLSFRIRDLHKILIAPGYSTNLHDTFEHLVFPILAAYRENHPLPNECPKCWRQMKRFELFTSVETTCPECDPNS